MTHARAAVTAAKRSVEVPSDFPARLETAKGRNSWSWVAKELKRDPKTVMKLRTPGAFIDGPVYEAALEWVNGRETAKRSLSNDVVKKALKCTVCGADTSSEQPEQLCWVCRRLKISAWRDNEQQLPAQE